MFCENCGNKLGGDYKFCIKCGYSNTQEAHAKTSSVNNHLDQRWWLRLAKVIYVFLYIPLPFAVALVWSENISKYDYYTQTYTDTIGEAFWYSLVTLIIWAVILRLIKITFLYIAFAQKPRWKREFKKFF